MRQTTRVAAVLAVAARVGTVAACSGGGPGSSSADTSVPFNAEGGYWPTGDGDGRSGFQPEYDAREQPQSTFALDIDTASYVYARRRLLDGQLVDPATIRPEEFINAFPYDYRPPPGDGFAITVDGRGCRRATAAPARTTSSGWACKPGAWTARPAPTWP